MAASRDEVHARIKQVFGSQNVQGLSGYVVIRIPRRPTTKTRLSRPLPPYIAVSTIFQSPNPCSSRVRLLEPYILPTAVFRDPLYSSSSLLVNSTGGSFEEICESRPHNVAGHDLDVALMVPTEQPIGVKRATARMWLSCHAGSSLLEV